MKPYNMLNFNNMMKGACVGAMLCMSVLMAGCGGGKDEPNPTPDPPTPPEPPVEVTADMVRGADVSWLTRMEDQGWKFYYPDGTAGDCMAILKDCGMNTVRLRLWVNPENSYCGTADVLAKARRAKALGMDIMLDFHYSDSWADPSKQNVPKAWSSLDFNGLVEAVGSYTRTTLEQFAAAGIDVKYVQVGNETGNGMLWPMGQADKNPGGYVALNNAGYDAVKAVYPKAKVIVHLQDGQKNSLFRWLLDILRNNGGRYDVIGMSLYPDQTDYMTYVAQCKANMIDCVSRYGKEVMLVEVGMGNSYVTECRAFLDACLALGEAVPDNKFLGVLYWEPEVYNDFEGYRKGAFTTRGRPGAQLEAFRNK